MTFRPVFIPGIKSVVDEDLRGSEERKQNPDAVEKKVDFMNKKEQKITWQGEAQTAKLKETI